MHVQIKRKSVVKNIKKRESQIVHGAQRFNSKVREWCAIG